MRKIFIASHDNFSEGLKNALKLICGSLADDITTYCLNEGESADDFAKDIEPIIDDNNCKDIIIFTDLYGASVCNAMTRLTINPKVVLFSGMNLPMILDVLICYSNKLSDEDIENIISNAQQNIKLVKLDTTIEDEEEF